MAKKAKVKDTKKEKAAKVKAAKIKAKKAEKGKAKKTNKADKVKAKKADKAKKVKKADKVEKVKLIKLPELATHLGNKAKREGFKITDKGLDKVVATKCGKVKQSGKKLIAMISKHLPENIKVYYGSRYYVFFNTNKLVKYFGTPYKDA